MEAFMTFLLFVGTIALAAVVFAVWIVVSVVRAVILGVKRLGAVAAPRPPRQVGDAVGGRCPQQDCRAPNPDHARFCARCGRPMRAAWKGAA